MSPLRWVLIATTALCALVASYSAAELGDVGSVYLWCYALTCGAMSAGAALTLISASAVVMSGVIMVALGLYLERHNR